LKVSEAMRRDVATIDEDTTIVEASRVMREKGEGCAIVMRKNKPVGMLTERDVTWKVVGEGLDPNSVKAGDVMSTPLVTVDPDADLVEAAKVMERHKVRRLAVTRGDTLYGVIRAVDIARHLEDYLDTEVRRILRSAFFFPVR